MAEMFNYTISEQDFDLTLIPEDVRTVGTDLFRKAVTGYIRSQYKDMGGDTTVTFVDGAIMVTWIPDGMPMESILMHLSAGEYDKALPMLESLYQVNPQDPDVLYNLGMVYSDQGRLDKAQKVLHQATEVNPENANCWTALGVAFLRDRKAQKARKALEKALVIEPENSFALRNLGSMHAMNSNFNRAVVLLRESLQHAPDDPITLLSLGQALLADNRERNLDEADTVLRRAAELSPHGEIGDKARSLRSSIANQIFRNKLPGNLRMDAVMYCLGALERFEGMDQPELNPKILEMATLGQSGLNVNDPSKSYRLKLTPGEFSGLQIVCMMHVGLKKLNPEMDAGMNLDKEYEAALSLYAGKKSNVNKT